MINQVTIYKFIHYACGEGNVNPLQYSCLENSIDGGSWWATVHGVTKSWTRLSDFTHTMHGKGLLNAACRSKSLCSIEGL